MTEIQNSQIRHKTSINRAVRFENWFFGFEYYLEFEYCDLGYYAVSGKSNRFYLNQLEFILMFP